MSTVAGLKEKRKGLITEARKIYESGKSSGADMADEQRERFDTLLSEAETLRQDIERIERVEALEKSMQESEGRASPDLPHNDPSNNPDGRHAYSVMKALRQTLQSRTGEGRGLDGLEAEVHTELAKRKHSSVKGVMIPWDAGGERRALDTTAGKGGKSIQTTLGSLIELLRNRLAIASLGTTVMTGMQGLFSLPRQSGAGTGYWLSEGGAPTPSNQTIDQVPFIPKTVGAYTDYTRQFMLQSSLEAESFVRNDLTAVVALAVESAAVSGTGDNNQPLGLLTMAGQTGGPAVVALGENGGELDWASLVELETRVATKNADIGSLGYLTNAAVRGHLKTAEKATGYPVYLWADGSHPVNSYPCAITNTVPSNLTKGTAATKCSAMIFGNWADLVMAFWSGMDVVVDPYALSTSGGIRIIVLQDVDINIRHPESFAVCRDILTGK